MTNDIRPGVLSGKTYMLKTPDTEVFLTINDRSSSGKLHPFEIFITSKNPTYSQWLQCLSELLTTILKLKIETSNTYESLNMICDPDKGNYFDVGKCHNSLVSHISFTIQKHINGLEKTNEENEKTGITT